MENVGEETGSDPWSGSDRDYQYDELLQRVFGIMRDKNPEMGTGKTKKFVMRPPQVVKVGTKKTAFANFIEIARCFTDSLSIYFSSFLLSWEQAVQLTAITNLL